MKLLARTLERFRERFHITHKMRGTKPNPQINTLMMETPEMSDHVQALKPVVFRAIDAYKKAVSDLKSNISLNEQLMKEMDNMEAKAADDKVTIEALTFALTQEFPEDVGGSTGGVVG